MHIEQARIEGGELILKTKDPAACSFVFEFKPGEYELKKKPKKRSKNANAFCWDLCSRIAAVINSTKEEVYRKTIKEVGIYTPLPIKAEAVEEFKKIWSSHGVGWFVEVVDESKIPGYKLIFAYNGTSTYDTAQMSRVIDSLIEDAKALGLEVLSEREKSLLLEDWENGKE